MEDAVACNARLRLPKLQTSIIDHAYLLKKKEWLSESWYAWELAVLLLLACTCIILKKLSITRKHLYLSTKNCKQRKFTLQKD